MFSLCPPWSVLAIAWRGTVRLSNACMFKIDFSKFRNHGKSQHFSSIFLCLMTQLTQNKAFVFDVLYMYLVYLMKFQFLTLEIKITNAWVKKVVVWCICTCSTWEERHWKSSTTSSGCSSNVLLLLYISATN